VRVAVIGGGLAGLVAALQLTEGGGEVVVLEAGDRFGGQIRTTRDRGFLIEEGAEGFEPATSPSLLGLIRDLRLTDEIAAPERLPSLLLSPEGLRGPRPGEPVAPSATMQGGMATIAGAISRRLERQADLRVGNAAVAVTRIRPGWTVYPEIGSALLVDAVVLALPPRPAAWLVHPLSPDAARALAALGTRPLVTVAAAYPRRNIRHPLNAAGFAVARDPADDGIERCLFVSSVFRGRAPADWALLRTVIRPARGELIATTDERWAEVVHGALSPALGIRELPDGVWVARWADAVPLLDERYGSRVAEARTALRALGRIELAGAAFEGGGFEAAIRSGRAAAERILAT
jgi:protoporphyrinogen/coproporphyrinogen III oxidase